MFLSHHHTVSSLALPECKDWELSETAFRAPQFRLMTETNYSWLRIYSCFPLSTALLHTGVQDTIVKMKWNELPPLHPPNIFSVTLQTILFSLKLMYSNENRHMSISSYFNKRMAWLKPSPSTCTPWWGMSILDNYKWKRKTLSHAKTNQAK